MKKYIAKQILPEYQESPLMWEGDDWEGTWLEGLCILGNSNYNEHKSPPNWKIFSVNWNT